MSALSSRHGDELEEFSSDESGDDSQRDLGSDLDEDPMLVPVTIPPPGSTTDVLRKVSDK